VAYQILDMTFFSEEIQSLETTSERYFKVPAMVEPPSPTDRIIPSNTVSSPRKEGETVENKGTDFC